MCRGLVCSCGSVGYPCIGSGVIGGTQHGAMHQSRYLVCHNAIGLDEGGEFQVIDGEGASEIVPCF